MLICDVSTFEAIQWAELLKAVTLTSDIEFNVVFVTKEWNSIFLKKKVGHFRFTPDASAVGSLLHDENNVYGLSIVGLAELLRHYDSQSFWQNAENQEIDDFFIDEQVIWCRSDNGERYSIAGYLDFSQALTSMERYKTCRRALKRCLHLFPDSIPLPSDELARSLLSNYSVDGIRNAEQIVTLREGDDDRHIVVGSVCITSGTMRKFTKRRDLNVSQMVSVFIHPDADNNKDVLPTLLWAPEAKRQKNSNSHHEAPKYERIPSTPYISRLGERAISVLRFRKESENFQAYFPRSPEQMYRDFEKYSALKIGHWTYGTRHELIGINLALALDLCWIEKGEMTQWIIDQISSAFINEKAYTIIVYPSHDVTDKLINILRSTPELENILHSGNVLPVRLFKESTVSPLIISPLVKEKVERIVSNGRHSSQIIKAIIIDDGVITGKHQRELKEFLTANGVNSVSTISILDRYGSPVNEELIEKYIAENKCYWRWDVPTLGHSRDCLLCTAIQTVGILSGDFWSTTLSERLNEWVVTWQQSDISSKWDISGVQALLIEPPVETTFGIKNTEEGVRKNRVKVYDSTSLASLVLELTRLTTKADVSLSKIGMLRDAKNSFKISDDDRIDVSIEIAASQFLLFFDEMDHWQKVERIKILMDLVWYRQGHSPMTALAGLCLSIVDQIVLDELWDEFRNLYFQRIISSHTDSSLIHCIIFNRISNVKRTDYLREIEISGALNDIEKKNRFLAGISHSISGIVREMFGILGETKSKTHTTAIQKSIQDILRTEKEGSYDPSAWEILKRDTLKLRGALQAFSFSSVLDRGVDTLADAKRLDDILKVIEQGRGTFDTISLVGEEDAFLFGDQTHEGIAQRYRERLLRQLHGKEYICAFLDSVKQHTLANWEKIVEDKSIHKAMWTEKNNQIRRPVIRCGSAHKWEQDCSIYFDRYVLECLEGLIANVVYASSQITSPWTDHNNDRADMWWRARLDKGLLTIEFANDTDREDFEFKMKISTSALEQVGGNISRDARSGIAFTSIHIPIITSLTSGVNHGS